MIWRLFSILLLVSNIAVADHELFMAICAKESGGNYLAWNEKEKAAGIAQITPDCVTHINRIMGEKMFTLEDRWSIEKSYEMFCVYTEHIISVYYKNSKLPRRELKARIWNGSILGPKKLETWSYWVDVERRLYGRAAQ
jgi:hypothetical protein